MHWCVKRCGQRGKQLVTLRHPMRDRVPAGPHRCLQRGRRRRIGDQGPQLGPVRAQRACQHERIELVVFGADDLYRDRKFFTCRDVITTTVRPAASRALTSTSSPCSIATSLAPAPRKPCDHRIEPAL